MKRPNKGVLYIGDELLAPLMAQLTEPSSQTPATKTFKMRVEGGIEFLPWVYPFLGDPHAQEAKAIVELQQGIVLH